MEQSKKGISGHVLKLIAIVTMLIDHIGAVVVERMFDASDAGQLLGSDTGKLYLTLRIIGRMAFPIFCWLIVEGYVYTSDRKKYATRLAAFALISEIPFDLANNGRVLEFTYQNVYFTLLLGFLTMFFWDLIEEKVKGAAGYIVGILMVAGMCGLAWLLHTDYKFAGVLCIIVMYKLREKNKLLAFAIGVLELGLTSSILEFAALLMLIPMYFYNGTRGKQSKYFFYIFYPAHLLILVGVAYLMGLPVAK